MDSSVNMFQQKQVVYYGMSFNGLQMNKSDVWAALLNENCIHNCGAGVYK